MNPNILGGIADFGSKFIGAYDVASQEAYKNNLIKNLIVNALSSQSTPQVTGITPPTMGAGGFGGMGSQFGLGIPTPTPQIEEVPKDKSQMLRDFVTDKSFGSLMSRDPSTALQLLEYVGGMGAEAWEPKTRAEQLGFAKERAEAVRAPKEKEIPSKMDFTDWNKAWEEAKRIQKATGLLPNLKQRKVGKKTFWTIETARPEKEEPGFYEREEFKATQDIEEKKIAQFYERYIADKKGNPITISLEEKDMVEQQLPEINALRQKWGYNPVKLEFVNRLGLKRDYYQLVPDITPIAPTGETEPAVSLEGALPAGITEEDIQFTMQKHGVTREEVLRRLGQ